VSARGEAIAEPGLARPVARERAQAGRRERAQAGRRERAQAGRRERAQAGRAARSADVVRGGR
jgi:hypothetical protein